MTSSEIVQSITTTLPNALNELNQTHSNLDKITQYCKSAYSQEPDQNAVFQKTQNYIKDALSRVAYDIHTVGLHLTNFLQLQANEIEKLDLQIQTLTDRMKAAHDNTGASGFRTMEAVKTYQKKPKMKKCDENELPENARSLNRFTRQSINLKALDNVGMDLTGHKGTDVYNISAPSVNMESSNSFQATNIHSPPTFNAPTMAPPPFNPPPGVNLGVPPPLSSPNFEPPPPFQQFDLPPLPPPREY